jgi:hypothetical protein
VIELDGRDYVGCKTWYVSIRLNSGDRYKRWARANCRIRRGILDLNLKILTFCDVLYISLITKASEA